MGFFYDWHDDWHEHSKRKRHRQKLNDWHNDWHEHSKRKRQKKAHFNFQLQNSKKMLIITDKVRITLKNEVVAKQKRLIHSVSIFEVKIEKFLELVELLPHAQKVVFFTPSGAYVTLEYMYQGNEYKYYLENDQTQNFLQFAKEKNLKYKEHEI